VVDQRWRAGISGVLAHNGELQASSITRVMVAESFHGSHQSLTRHLRSVRRPVPGCRRSGHHAHPGHARRGFQFDCRSATAGRRAPAASPVSFWPARPMIFPVVTEA
jgi:hypothetical protein